MRETKQASSGLPTAGPTAQVTVRGARVRRRLCPVPPTPRTPGPEPGPPPLPRPSRCGWTVCRQFASLPAWTRQAEHRDARRATALHAYPLLRRSPAQRSAAGLILRAQRSITHLGVYGMVRSTLRNYSGNEPKLSLDNCRGRNRRPIIVAFVAVIACNACNARIAVQCGPVGLAEIMQRATRPAEACFAQRGPGTRWPRSRPSPDNAANWRLARQREMQMGLLAFLA